MQDAQAKLIEAVEDGDIAGITTALSEGADINAADETDNTPLMSAIFSIMEEERRWTVTKFLLEHGALPNSFEPDTGGPLFNAVIWKDEPVIALLLEHGADPNILSDAPESLLEFAEDAYIEEVLNGELPEATDEEAETIDAWLDFLDRTAVSEGVRRPDYLLLLRNAGAKTFDEIQGS